MLALAAGHAAAEPYRLERVTAVHVNDSVFQGLDRWRTGSAMLSVALARQGDAEAMPEFGDLLELRLSAEFVTPEFFLADGAGDRRYAGILSVGAHTHFRTRGLEATLGADLHVIGPQNRLHEVQDIIHVVSGGASAPPEDQMVPDSVWPTLAGELARPVALDEGQLVLQPFLGLQAGHETLARVGGDLYLGQAVDAGTFGREPVTGLPFRLSGAGGPGVWGSLGVDIAAVGSSALLGHGTGDEPRDTRTRVRAGLGYDVGRLTALAGVAWLGPEFEAQRSGQWTAAFALGLSF
ncbi:DUF2219 family protein [Halovulum dunhuangense]|uniref:DUF2219 family protein n=1 Tax=Halovulum dunhuangense TaxID=1505036 RepID=A0A849L579_9RHOB|nr:lipid A-modifier LpxR family protein [Halovulum dunhuangense]NNU81277.1 DUF2219 family protein [Halovulum dunhuangense]